MTMTLVCARADLFAAAASVIMNLTEANPPGLPSVAAGSDADDERHRRSADPVSRAGAAPAASRRRDFWSTEKTLEFWRRANGCERKDAATTDLGDRDPDGSDHGDADQSHCPPARDVVLYRVNGGGHRMPGAFSDARFPRVGTAILGPQNATSTAPTRFSGVFPEIS